LKGFLFGFFQCGCIGDKVGWKNIWLLPVIYLKLFAVFQAIAFSETDDIRSCPPRLQVIVEHEADDLGAFLIANDMILVTTGKTMCSS